MNIRTHYEMEHETTGHIGLATMEEWTGNMIVKYYGRTKKAQIPKHLMGFLKSNITLKELQNIFPVGEFDAILYGEGFGPKIQNGGKYINHASFVLFDVFVKDHENPLGGWWLEYENVMDIASKLNIDVIPSFGMMTTDEIVELVKQPLHSKINPDIIAEGIVARSKPLLFTRKSEKLMWKLKCSDFYLEENGIRRI